MELGRQSTTLTTTMMSCFAFAFATPSSGHACGGLFCGAPPPVPAPPEPVDQSAERIAFEVLPSREISAHVQISYVGPADEFAWIVPVPSVPVVEESSIAFFDQLDDATRMPVTLPAAECQPPAFNGSDGSSFGCGLGAFENDQTSVAQNREPPSPNGQSPVTRYDSGMTANFSFDVIGAEDSTDLIEWLQDNGYNVSANMTPVMDLYVGMKFLALKLRDGRSARDIVPIKMTYQSDQPVIPIRMTAVAAQPFMGILVYVLGATHYLPENYDLTKPVRPELSFDENGRTNYFDWVARKSDEADGHLFVLEALTTLGNGQQKLSRFYTRMSPEHMTLDPAFRAAPGLRPYQAELDFSTRPALWDCLGPMAERIPSPCAFNYCGADSTCSVQDGTPACQCPRGKVAQSVAGPDGTMRIACVPATNPVGITDEAAMVGTDFDPCRNARCGAGTCVLKGGFTTCACEEDSVAQLDRSGNAVSCRPAVPDAPTFGPGAGIESQPAVTARRMATSRGLAYAGGVWLLLALAFASRWRGARFRGRGR